MAALATEADLEAILGRPLTAAESARAPGLLESASTKVRSWTRQQFDLVTDDVLVIRPIGTVITLPQKPVNSVKSVKAISGIEGQAPFLLAAWVFDGINKINLDGLSSDILVSMPEWFNDGYGPDTYEVVYSHGYATVPDDVKDVVADMVLRTLLSPSMVAGMVNERIGQYGYGLQQGSGATGASVRMTKDDKEALDGYRTRSGTIQMRSM